MTESIDFSQMNPHVIDEFRSTGGKVGGMFEGKPIVLVHHSGAKSGTERVTPLVPYLMNGRIFVFGANGGSESNPHWLHNLVARPHTTVELGTETFPVIVRVVTGPERDEIFTQQCAAEPIFAMYQDLTTRIIPVLELSRGEVTSCAGGRQPATGAVTESAIVMDAQFEHGQVEANGISIHTVSIGEGPLVVFCHGFPESWYSWRHQLPAVAAAGFRAVALDMRGYGRTSTPTAVDAYSLSHLVGDVVGTVNAIGADQAVVVGHDWGAPVAWYCALMRPDLFRAVAALSVPYIPPITLPDGLTMNDLMRANAGDREYYRLYFQQPGVAEADLEADVDHSVRGLLYSISGDIVADGIHPTGWDGHFPTDQGLAEQLVIPEALPSWLTEADVEFYVSELSANGFRGGLNWYRNINAMPAVLGPFVGASIKQPALYLGGEHDLIAGNTAEAIAALPGSVPGLRGVQILPGAGHWLQQERPQEVNAALLDFLTSL